MAMLCFGVPFLLFLAWYSGQDRVGRAQRAERRAAMVAHFTSALTPRCVTQPEPEISRFITRCTRTERCSCAVCKHV